MDPNTPTPRRNVTAEELAAQREPPPRTLGEMQRDALKVLNRELAFVEQASDAALAGNGTLSNEQWVRFKDAMGVIKQHLVEERSAPPVDPTKLTEEQLQAEIEKRKIADAKDWVASR
jgi:hypothetical protein